MKQIHTHYDNLKVARNAPPEVIRAAYKSLSQKFHPDLNPGDTEAARIMAIINASYEVLSDPEKRQNHDLWIAQQENFNTNNATENNQSRQTTERNSSAPIPPEVGNRGRNVFGHIFRNWLWYGIAVIIIWNLVTDEPRSPQAGPKPYQSSPPPAAQQEYVRPIAAPNGQPWPNSADYVRGYQRFHTKGLSKVTVDNSQNDSDVFVKLVSLDGAQAYPVRTFFIPAYGKFTLNKVSAGNYDIRYRDLNSGGLSRSEPFQLEEVSTDNGTQFSNLRMTLYKVANGNMQTYALSEAEF